MVLSVSSLTEGVQFIWPKVSSWLALCSEAGKIVPNIALFGRPVEDGLIHVRCVNRLYLRQVAYDVGFGPAEI